MAVGRWQRRQTFRVAGEDVCPRPFAKRPAKTQCQDTAPRRAAKTEVCLEDESSRHALGQAPCPSHRGE